MENVKKATRKSGWILKMLYWHTEIIHGRSYQRWNIEALTMTSLKTWSNVWLQRTSRNKSASKFHLCGLQRLHMVHLISFVVDSSRHLFGFFLKIMAKWLRMFILIWKGKQFSIPMSISSCSRVNRCLFPTRPWNERITGIINKIMICPWRTAFYI